MKKLKLCVPLIKRFNWDASRFKSFMNDSSLNTLRKDRLYSLTIVCEHEFLHFHIRLNKDVQQ